tara:strand:+ start:937 stop:1791 length:855 start_codon:yes stop_codon:yes gene_type:complete
MKILKYLTQSLFIYTFFILGRLIGINSSRIIFSFLFLKLGPLFKSKKIIEKNLENFNKNLSENEKRNIICNMWKNYGKTFIEYVYLDIFRNNNSHIIIEGQENLKNYFKKNKPVIFVSGHFANFELMSMEITKKNIPLATIYRPLNNFFINPLMEYLRRKYICKNQIKKGINGVRTAIEYIRKNVSIALMIDQRVSEGEKVNFFNKPALTTTLPAQLSIKYNLSIIPVMIERSDKNKFKIIFYQEIKASSFKNKKELTQELNKILEKMIIKNPNEWIWTHDRWK